jgi:hypothetical protein
MDRLEKYQVILFSKFFRRTALIVFMCTMVVVDGYAQEYRFFTETKDSILKPDSNNVVRIANTDNITYIYYFDSSKTKPRSEFVYSIDKTDCREVIFIRYYCFSGQKSIEKTYKNYNRKLKKIDPGFTIPKQLIAYLGESPDPRWDHCDLPLGDYTQIGADLAWYCNGNRRYSAWRHPTNKTTAHSSCDYKAKGFDWIVENVTELDDTVLFWYESGNLYGEYIYNHGKSVKSTLYFDSPDKKNWIVYIYKENKKNEVINVYTVHNYPNDSIDDYTVRDINTGEITKHVEYYPNRKIKLLEITQPDFVVDETYDSTGKPIRLNRKVLYQNEWYEYNEQYFPNGQLKRLEKESIFFALHPEYGTMPDSMTYYRVVHNDQGGISEKSWKLTTGESHYVRYRIDGSLWSKQIISPTGAGVSLEYDEQGNISKERHFQQNPK